MNQEYIYFGECMVSHTIRYDLDNTPPFIGLDIMVHIENVKGESFGLLSRESKVKEFERLGLPVIPILWEGQVSKLNVEKLEKFITKSNYGTTQMEGIVIKNYERLNRWGRPVFAKIVTEHFREINKIAFRGMKKTSDKSIKLTDLVVTPTRVRKMIMKLVVEEGKSLGMPLMQDLPIRVWKDMWEEEWHTLVIDHKPNELDLRAMRKRSTNICLKELQRYLAEQVVSS